MDVEDIGFAVSVALVLAIFFMVGNISSDISCDKSWPDRQHRYSFMTGCMVKTDDGEWVPDENYRVIK